MVAKKTEGYQEEYRRYVDYRGLNLVTKRDYFPLPRLQDVLEQFRQAKYFSTLDLASDYWKIEREEKSKPYTAFSMPAGHYHCLRMPFGLAKNPSSWCRLMSVAMAGLTPEICFIYLDIIVFGITVEEKYLITCEKLILNSNPASVN